MEKRSVIYIAVIGPGDDAAAVNVSDAREVGALIAARGWITITGGRDAGVMAAAAEGAASKGGISIGLLPGSDRSQAAPVLTVSIPTGLGEARNAVLVNAAGGVIACGLNAGTLSELALALRARRPTVLVRADASAASFLATLGAIVVKDTPVEAVEWMAEQRGVL